MKKLALAMALMLGAAAHAECSCQCVNGQQRQLCTSSMDLPAICAPTICPIAPHSIAPIQMPTIPPLGTSSCRQVQVLNPYTGQYQWQQVCR